MYVKSQKCFSRFFKKREQFTNSAVGLNKTKRNFLNCNKRERVYFDAHNERRKKISVIYRRIVKLATGSCEGTSGLRVEQ